MTDVNRYRDGELSSTALMQDAMERAHAVAQGEGKTLEWHKDHESMDAARARMHEEPAQAFKAVASYALGLVTRDIGKTVLKDAPRVFGDKAYYAEKVVDGARYVAGVGAAEGIPVALLVAAGVVAVGEVGYAIHQARELRHLSDVDGLDVATTKVLDLDPGFRTRELENFPTIAASKTVALFVDAAGRPTEFGAQHLPDLQAAADAGARVALKSMTAGGSLSLAERPDIQKRIDDDIAFSKGFRNVFFITSLPDGNAKLRALQERMDARTVTNDAAVQVKG